MNRLTVLCAIIALTGCAAQSGSNGTLQRIAAFTVTDLDNAEAEAVAQNDVLAIPCYPALRQFVQSLNSGPATTVSGAFSAFQAARGVRMSIQGGLPPYLKLGCAALVIDEQNFLLGLAAIGAGAAVVGPFAPVLLHGV